MEQAGKKVLMMGNEAIARGLIENGCRHGDRLPGDPGLGDIGGGGRLSTRRKPQDAHPVGRQRKDRPGDRLRRVQDRAAHGGQP